MSKALSIALILLFNGLAAAQMPVAELPRIYVDTTWRLPVGGTTWAAHTSAQLSSALKASAPGDRIVLDAGTVYTGNFILPAKSNPSKQWIYIMSSKLSSLPQPGHRVAPSDAVNMPKIVTPNASQALLFSAGANHWRFSGIEVYSASTYRPSSTYLNYYGYSMIDTAAPGSPQLLQDSITFDRCYIHGDATHDVQRAVGGNASNYALLDNYISEIHMAGTDSQAFAAWSSPGPFKLVNNYLAAAGENVMFGGAGGYNNPYVPSDIELRNNYLFKPLSWVPLSLNGQMVVKSSFELKSGQRVLFDGNTIENEWKAGQNGYAVTLTVRSSQSGDIAVVNDVTITNNILKNVTAGFNTLAADDQCATSTYYLCKKAGSQDRWNISNNLVTFYDPRIAGGGNNALIMLNGGWDNLGNKAGVMRDVIVRHNTTVAAASAPCWDSAFFSAGGQTPPLKNLTSNIWILDNVLCGQPFGDWGLQGTAGITQYMGDPGPVDPRFKGNVMYVPVGTKVQAWPAHNYATTLPFSFVDPSHGNYQLTSPFWTDTSDSKLAGIDNATLQRGQGTPSSAPVVIPGNSSNQAIYTAVTGTGYGK